MKFYNINGNPVYKNIEKFRIDWDKKSKSKIQGRVKEFLRPFWERFICYEEMVLAGSRLSLDIVNMTKKIAVEVHGEQHTQFVPFFHRKREGLTDQIERDERTKKWCEQNDIKLVEIYTHNMPVNYEWFQDIYEINL